MEKEILKIKKQLKLKMEEQKITQEDMAKKLGIKKKSFQNYISGTSNIPKNILKKLYKKGFLKDVIPKDLEMKKISNSRTINNKDFYEKTTRELKKTLAELEMRIKTKQFEYEKLERTSGAKSKITWACIDIQKYLSGKIIEIGNIYSMSDNVTQISSSKALKQLSYHLKKFATNIDDIVKKSDEIILEQEEKAMDVFEKYNIKMPKRNFSSFDTEDKMKILTFSVGKIVPRVLKELDTLDKKMYFTARKTSLLIKGKADPRERYRMKQYIVEYGEYFENLEDDISSTLGDILEEVIEDMVKYNKSKKRREQFFNTLDSPVGLQLLFTVAMISIGEYLLEQRGSIKNGRYLEQVLIARQELTRKIKTIFKKMNLQEYSEAEAKDLFKQLIEEKVQQMVKIDMELYDEIRLEEDLTRLCEESSLNEFILTLVENAREKATRRPKLISMIEIENEDSLY
ncbi:helix-turn-helix domain-containing protein [Fusobacterium necrophorum subsp. funduliforme]